MARFGHELEGTLIRGLKGGFLGRYRPFLGGFKLWSSEEHLREWRNSDIDDAIVRLLSRIEPLLARRPGFWHNISLVCDGCFPRLRWVFPLSAVLVNGRE